MYNQKMAYYSDEYYDSNRDYYKSNYGSIFNLGDVYSPPKYITNFYMSIRTSQ